MEDRLNYHVDGCDDDDGLFDDESFCPDCLDDGAPGGCKKCGMYPPNEPIVVDGVEYYFSTNTEVNSKIHQDYERLQKAGGIRILFKEDAFDRYNNHIPDYVAIWIASEEKELAQIAKNSLNLEGVYP